MPDTYKILIVEDSKTYQFAYSRILKGNAFDLKFMDQGKELIATTINWKPDLIILDIHLPDANGVDLCSQLNSLEETQDIPIVIVTSDSTIEVLRKAYEAGALDYIRKPFNDIELIIRIENVLRQVIEHNQIVDLKRNLAIAEMGRSVAHHINQPLTTILGAAEMLKMYKSRIVDDQEFSDLINMIIEGSKELSELVQKIENVKFYRTKEYLSDIHIIDLNDQG